MRPHSRSLPGCRCRADFSLFTDLVGNLVTPVIGFFVPVALYLLIRHRQERTEDREVIHPAAPRANKCDIARAWAVLAGLLGCFAMVIGMRSTVIEIVDPASGAGD